MVRAYADDTALVIQNLGEHIEKLETIFEEFAQCSGLKLNLKKSMVVHLNSLPQEDNETNFLRLAGRWKVMTVQSYAKYLGFILGPGRGHRSWDKLLAKFNKRIHMWGLASELRVVGRAS